MGVGVAVKVGVKVRVGVRVDVGPTTVTSMTIAGGLAAGTTGRRLQASSPKMSRGRPQTARSLRLGAMPGDGSFWVDVAWIM